MSNNLKSSTAQIITNIDDCVSNPLQFISKKFVVNEIDRIAFQEVNEIWKNTPDLKHFREYKPHNWCKNRCCCFRWLKKGELSSDNDPNYTEHTLTCKKGNGCCLARNCCQLPHCRCTWFICQRNLSQEEKDYNRRFSEGATDKTKPENRPKSKCILVRYAFLVRLLLPLFWSLLVIVFQVYSVGNCSFAGFGTGKPFVSPAPPAPSFKIVFFSFIRIDAHLFYLRVCFNKGIRILFCSPPSFKQGVQIVMLTIPKNRKMRSPSM